MPGLRSWSRFLPELLLKRDRKVRSDLDRLEQAGRHAATVLMDRLDQIDERLDRVIERLARIEASVAGDAAASGNISQYHQLIGRLDRLEFLSRGRATYVGNNRVLVKCVIGDRINGYLVEADDLLIGPWFMLTGCYEDDLVNYFVRALSPDSRCLDIGANFGFFTCLFARFAPQGKVLGIEPSPATYELLKDNILINDLHYIATPLNAAVSDEGKTVMLHFLGRRSGNTSMVAPPRQPVLESWGVSKMEAFEIASVRIDDLMPQFAGKIDFIKIDVEGAEPLALRGARETIAANPQLRIVMEWSPGQLRDAGFDVAEFANELKQMGLGVAAIGPAGVDALSLEELPALSYKAGILLSRA